MAHSSDNPSTSYKRTKAGTFKSHDDQITQWLEKDSEHKFSDVDDEDGDPTYESET